LISLRLPPLSYSWSFSCVLFVVFGCVRIISAYVITFIGFILFVYFWDTKLKEKKTLRKFERLIKLFGGRRWAMEGWKVWELLTVWK
jgi:hypothetical protein